MADKVPWGVFEVKYAGLLCCKDAAYGSRFSVVPVKLGEEKIGMRDIPYM